MPPRILVWVGAEVCRKTANRDIEPFVSGMIKVEEREAN